MKIYYAPMACSGITIAALEEIGLDYEAIFVDAVNGDQHTEAYRRINPKAEVPAVEIDGRIFTQNPSILYYLANRYPEAKLLPQAGGKIGVNETLEDLNWCSSTLHIMRRQVANPKRFGGSDSEGVKANGTKLMNGVLDTLTQRVADGGWWYGDKWSIIDNYLNWSFSEPIHDILAISERPEIMNYAKRIRARPSFVRAREREKNGIKFVATIY